jgi:prephenate dehydrogenase
MCGKCCWKGLIGGREMDLTDFKITIVGMGLLGGSFALAFRDLKPGGIFGVDIDKEALRYAEFNGIIDKGYENPEEPLKISDIVIICLYPTQVASFIEKYLNIFKKGSLVADIAGIKGSIAEKAERLERKDIEIICSHPMAGNEYSGIQRASKEIFKGANYIITPLKINNEEKLVIYENLMKSIGFGNVIRINPFDHDKIIALTSQLAHVVAVAIVNSDEDGIDKKYFTGGSYRDATRVAYINSDLWSQLLIENQEHIVNQIDLFQKEIGCIRDAILNMRKDDLIMHMDMAREKQEVLLL